MSVFVSSLLSCLLVSSSAFGLRIGVGGEYPLGYEGLLARMGLPRERILDSEQDQVEALSRYDVVFQSAPSQDVTGASAAFDAYVRNGGRGLLEEWTYLPTSFFEVPYTVLGNADLLIVNEEHPVASGYANGDVIDFYDMASFSLDIPASATVQIPVRLVAKGTESPVPQDDPRVAQGEGKPAILVFTSWGKGTLVAAPASLGFSVFWRGNNALSLARNTVLFLVGEGIQPRFEVDEHGVKDLEPVPEPGTSGVSQESSRSVTPVPAQGFLLVGEARGDYNVLAQLGGGEGAGEGAGEGEILFDYTRSGEGHGVAFWGGKIRLYSRSGGSLRVLREQVLDLDQARALVIKRRGRFIWVVVDRKTLFGTMVQGIGTGIVTVKPGKHLAAGAVRCQPIREPQFSDDFMREAGSLGEWEPMSGDWQTLAMAAGDTAANGFYCLGKSDALGRCRTGYWFWENYAFGVSVNPMSGCQGAGVSLLAQDPEDDWRVLICPGQPGTLKLIRERNGETQVLSEAEAFVDEGAWTRLMVRATTNRIEVFLDGKKKMTQPCGEEAFGQIGLMVDRGEAHFDDVWVEPAGEGGTSLPFGEGGAWPELPGSVGPADYCTWADRAVEWTFTPERPDLAWHKGRFWGDLALSLPMDQLSSKEEFRREVLFAQEQGQSMEGVSVVHVPPSSQVTLKLSTGHRKQTTKVPFSMIRSGGSRLRIQRKGGTLSVGLERGRDLLQGEASLDHTRLGLSLEGPPLNPNRMRWESEHVKDYVFRTTPSDWRPSSGTWEVSPRWSCNTRWSWLCGWSDEIAAIWNKTLFQGDILLDAYMSLKMEAPGGAETTRGRDLNLAILGDGKDPLSGYALVLGGVGGVETSLWRCGVQVASNPGVWLPRNYGLHHQWFHVSLQREGSLVRGLLEGREVVRFEDAEPLEEGYVGLWTRNSGLSIPRVTIYFQRTGE